MSPRFSAVSTSDDLKPTIFNSEETASRPSKNWRFFSVGRLLAWAYTQPHVDAVAERLCRRRRTCISSFAETSAVLISMDEILCIPLNSTHSASSTPPMDGTMRVLWRRSRPMDGQLKTTVSAFTDQTGMCWKQCHTLHPCFRALINLFPPISRPKKAAQYQDVWRWIYNLQSAACIPPAVSERPSQLGDQFWWHQTWIQGLHSRPSPSSGNCIMGPWNCPVSFGHRDPIACAQVKVPTF